MVPYFGSGTLSKVSCLMMPLLTEDSLSALAGTPSMALASILDDRSLVLDFGSLAGLDVFCLAALPLSLGSSPDLALCSETSLTNAAQLWHSSYVPCAMIFPFSIMMILSA